MLQFASVTMSSASFVVVGVILADLMAEYSLSLAGAGLVAVIRSAGEVAAAVSVGAAVGRIGTRRLFLLGNFLVGGAGVALLAVRPLAAVLVLLFLSGLGVQFVTACAAAMVGAGAARPGRNISLVFLAVSVGIVLTPAAAGWLLEAGASWRAVAGAIGALALLLALVQLRDGALPRAAEQEGDAAPLRRTLADPRIWMIAGTIFVWVTSNIVPITWLPTLARAELGAGDGLAGAALSAYTLGALVSRLLAVSAADRLPTRPLMLALAGAGTLLSAGVLAAGEIRLLLGAGFLLGVANGAMIPLFFLLTRKEISASAGVFGVVFTGLLAGETVMPGVAGWLAGRYGLRASFGLVTLALLATITLLSLYPSSARREDNPRPARI